MWVRAVPEDEDVAISIEQWSARPASSPRLATIAAVDHERLGESPLGWSVDDQLRLTTLDPAFAERLSLDPAAAHGQPLTKLFRLEEDESGEMPLLAALASRTSFTGQRAACRNGGDQFVLSGEIASGPDGVFAGFDGSAVSLADAAEATTPEPIVDTALRTALRSPLDSIVRSAEDMIDRSGAPVRDEYRAYAADIATAARHLLSVIRSLGEEADGRGQVVDLVELTSDAVALIESAADEREIAIAVQPMDSFAARGESRSIVQILVNLIGNAVRYTSERTAVTISYEKDGELALLHVADEGPGIELADQQRIFERFQQGRGGTEGSGLGLAISRRLAQSMGGDIRLGSAPGEGARFTLVLPAA